MSKVSIVLPSYNGEKYISKSIDSVLKQTYSDWELIIVNDCSTDHTLDIAREYADKDGRIKVISNITNKKLPTSLNIGFRNSTGNYLTWTSDDNLYKPNAIQEMVEFLEHDEKCYLVCADMEYIDFSGCVTGLGVPYDDSLIYIRDSVGACFMYRRCVTDKIGEYDTTKFLVEDYDYWLRIRSEFGEIKRIPKILYQYRKHSASLTSTRELDVCYQRAKLRIQYQDIIFNKYANNMNILYEIYYDFLRSKYLDEKFINKIKSMIPNVNNEMFDIEFKYPVIIFGAGEYGKRLYQLISKNVVAFVDNNVNIQGSELYNLPILSLEEVLNRYTRFHICLGIGIEHIYEVIKQIEKYDISSYRTYIGIERFLS